MIYYKNNATKKKSKKSGTDGGAIQQSGYLGLLHGNGPHNAAAAQSQSQMGLSATSSVDVFGSGQIFVRAPVAQSSHSVLSQPLSPFGQRLGSEHPSSRMSFNNFAATPAAPRRSSMMPEKVAGSSSDGAKEPDANDTLIIEDVEKLATYPAFLEFNVPSNIRLTRKIAEGGYGILYEGAILSMDIRRLAQESSQKCAVKVLKSPLNDAQGKPMKLNEKEKQDALEGQVAEFKQEVSVIHALQGCENIMKLLGCARAPQLAMITRVYSGNVSDYIHNPKKELDIRMAASFVYDTCSAIAAVHKLNFAHLDMKPLNLLIEEMADPSMNATGLKYRLVLCDFGLAKLGNSADLIRGRKHATGVGLSYRYAGPEGFYIFENQFDAQAKSKTKVKMEVYQGMDIYATAVTINEIVSREIPFGMAPYEEVRAGIKEGLRPRMVVRCTETPGLNSASIVATLNAMIVAGWKADWTARPKAEDLCNSISKALDIRK